jgi:hypothetical protein
VTGRSSKMRALRVGRWGSLVALGAIAAVAWAAPGGAEDEGKLSVVLDYAIGPGLRGCPSESEFRRAVAEQLAYDPFRTVATRHVAVSLRGGDRGIDGQVVWTDAAGAKEGERRLSSANGDCAELTRNMTFAVVVQIQLLETAGDEKPDAGPPRAPSPPAASSSAQHVTAPSPLEHPPAASSAPEPPSPASSVQLDIAPPRFVAGIGPSLAVGSAPSVAPAGRVFGGAEWRFLSFELGGEATLPVTFHQTDETGFKTRSIGATFAVCGKVHRFATCALGALGRWRVEGFGVDQTRTPSAWMGRAGFRLAFEQPLGARLSLRVDADGLGTLTPGTVYLNAAEAWSTPPLVLAFGFDLVARFP